MNPETMQFGDSRLPQSFWNRCIPEPNSGCWLWLGAFTGNGYGRCEIAGHSLAHRFALSVLVAIPSGMTADHRCNTTCCVNPAHLSLVTPAVNSQLRSQRKAICPNGHERTSRRGDCQQCARERSRRFKQRQRSSPAAAMSELPDAPISDALGLFLSARAADGRDA